MTAPVNLTAQGTTSYSTTTKKFGTASMLGTGAFSGYATDAFNVAANALTMECWFNAPSAPGAAFNLIQINNTTASRVTYINVGTTGFSSLIFFSGGVSKTLTVSTNVCDGAWHHIAAVFNPTSATLYIDGTGTTNANTPDTLTSATFAIGSNYQHSGGFLPSGDFIDEFAIFGYAKYTANFTPASSAYSGSEPYLCHLYHFDSALTDSAFPKVVFITATGTGTWTVPSDFTTSNRVECIGAGATGNVNYGGGGGAYARADNMSLSGTVNYRVGNVGTAVGSGNIATNTWFSAAATLCAAGAGDANVNSGAGGTTANSVGTNLAAGGTGYYAGSGSGGPHGAGQVLGTQSNVPQAGGTADNGQVAGGTTAGTAGASGTFWTSNPGGTSAGPGGGGGYAASTVNGAGGSYGGGGAVNYSGGTSGSGQPGIIVITYAPASAATAYSLTCSSAAFSLSFHSLTAGFGLNETSASYAFAPNNVIAGFGLQLGLASFAFSPNSATLTGPGGAHPYSLTIATASYAVTDHVLATKLGLQLPTASASYGFNPSNMTAGFGLAIAHAVYAFSPHVAAAVFGKVIPAVPASYGINTNPVTSSLNWFVSPAHYNLTANSATLNTSVTKDVLIHTIPYFDDVPVIYLVNDLNTIINSINQSILFYAFPLSALIPPFIMISPDELNEALNTLVRAFNGTLDLLSWGQAYHLKYFAGVSAPELTLAVNLLIDEINGFTVSH